MSENFNLPIFTKIYELYKEIYKLRSLVPKEDRYAIWQKIENITLETIEEILTATALAKSKKGGSLERASEKLNILRVFVRLSKDVRAIDNKKYIFIEERIDEIGRMLGGWIKSTKTS